MGIQLYGHLIEPMVEAARMAEAAGPDIIDINFGCPVKKIAGRGAGSGMMRDVPLMVEMTRRIVQAVRKPVTVKTRLGWDEESKNIEEIALRLQDVGIAALTVHGRTRAQMYRGEADWTLIGKVKNNPQIHIPIIGNGDVDSGPKAAEMFDRYGVDGVMIGRATYGRPWIFREVKHYLATGEVLPQPSVCERVEIAKEHLRKSLEVKGEFVGILEMRRHLSNYFKGLPDFKPTRLKLVTSLDIPELFDTLDSIARRWGDFDVSGTVPAPLSHGPVKRRATLFQHALDIGFVVLDDGYVPVVLEERRRDQKIGRRTVDGRRHVVERGQTQQGLDVHVVRLGRHRVPEENQGVDLAVGDQRTQLLVAAQRTGFEQRDPQIGKLFDLLATLVLFPVVAQRLFDHLAGRTRADQMVTAEFSAVPVHPFGQIVLHVVVGNQCQHFRPSFHNVSCLNVCFAIAQR